MREALSYLFTISILFHVSSAWVHFFTVLPASRAEHAGFGRNHAYIACSHMAETTKSPLI
nr:MAG TPA: hypothetical protein [Caudoviricetes sp.]